MSFNLSWEDANVVVTFGEDLDYQDISGANCLIIGDARFDDMQYKIFDFSKVKTYNISAKEVGIIGVFDSGASRFNHRIKAALVITDDIGKNLAKSYIHVMDDTNWKIQIFNTLDSAKNWCVKTIEVHK